MPSPALLGLLGHETSRATSGFHAFRRPVRVGWSVRGLWVRDLLRVGGIARLAAPSCRCLAPVLLTEAIEHGVEQVGARNPPTRTPLGRDDSPSARSLDGLTVN